MVNDDDDVLIVMMNFCDDYLELFKKTSDDVQFTCNIMIFRKVPLERSSSQGRSTSVVIVVTSSLWRT